MFINLLREEGIHIADNAICRGIDIVRKVLQLENKLGYWCM